MRAGTPYDDDRHPHAEENDPVWRLLAKSRPPEPDVWFAVRTLARCRHAEAPVESHGPAWSHLWRWVLGTGLGICLTVLVVTHVESANDNHQKNVQEAFEIMASLGNDSDASPSSSSTSWQDSSL